jgi:hypothetical protein
MKTTFLKCLFAVSLTALAVTAAPTRKVIVQVPFAFVAGSSRLPAGQYAVAEDEADKAVFVTNLQTGAAVVLLAEGNTGTSDGTRTSVNFVKVGNEYFMKVIRVAGGPGSCELIATLD